MKDDAFRAYCKLVRDRVPEELSRESMRYETQKVTGESYQQALLEKLVEEANEALEAGHSVDKLLVELADLLEVIESVGEAYDIDVADMFQMKAVRRAEMGGFDKGVVLLWTQDMEKAEVEDE